MPLVLHKRFSSLTRFIAVSIPLSISAGVQNVFAAPDTVEEVIITATRTEKPINAIPNSVRLVDKEMLTDQLAISTSLLDGLSFFIPSLTPGRQKLTSSGVTLRGRTPLYLVDGIPQSTPLRNGERSGFTIDPAFVERVEVIYGANAIQGVGATGGVINTVTLAAPKNEAWLRQLTFDITSDNGESNGLHYKTSALVGKKFGANDGVLGIAVDQRDLYHDGNGQPIAVDPVQGDSMDSGSFNLFGKYGYDFSTDQRLEISVNSFSLEGDGDYRRVAGNRSEGIPATSVKGQPQGDPTKNEALNIAVNYRHEALAQGVLSAQVYYYDFYALYGGTTTITFQDTSIAPMGSLFDQSALSSEKFGGKLTYVRDNTGLPGLQLVTGLDYLADETFQELAQTDRIWVPKMQFTGWAPFLQLEQALANEQVRISAGARYENVSLDVPTFTTIASANNTIVRGGSPSFSEALINAGLVYDPLERLTLFVSYAEGFTMPDAGLILRAVNTPEQTVDELVDLQPVVADNTEIGLNYHVSGWQLSASYFQSNSDLGSRIQVVNGAGQIRREKTEIAGFELATHYDFDTGAQVGANYARLNGRHDSDDDDRVDRDLDGRNISPNRLNLWVQSSFGYGLSGRVQLSHFFDRNFDGGLSENNFDGYQLLDVLMRCEHNALGEFSLGIQNLLAEKYLTYYAQTVSFVNDETFVAGRGRAINLGWKATF